MMKYVYKSDRNQSQNRHSNSYVIFFGFLLVLLLVLTGCNKKDEEQTDYSGVKANITKTIQASMKKYNLTGVSIALVDGDAKNQVVWSQGFGYADKENNIPATPSTVFRVGSISKLFTGMAIMQLAEQGKLDIEKPVQAYLPNLKINSHFNSTEPVTIRNMLTHHSGLPSDQIQSMWGSSADDSDLLKKTYDLASPPNTQYSYSNLAFGLLGQVIEKVSGLSYEEYVKQKLLTPMDMSQSYISNTLDTKQNHAKGYFNGKNYPIVPLRDVSAGGLNSTVLDLAKFAQMTFPKQSGKFLSDVSLKKMQSSQVDGSSPFIHKGFGLAWYFNHFLDKKTKGHAGIMTGHGGTTPLFHSEFMMLPKQKLAVVVMTNGGNHSGSGINDIANSLLKMAYTAKTRVTINPEPDFKLPPVEATSTNALNNMPGMWLSDTGVLLIAKKDNRLALYINNHDVPLVNRGNDTYYIDYESAGLTAKQAGVYANVGFKYKNNADTEAIHILKPNEHVEKLMPPQIHFAEKLKPQQLSDIWKNRLGNYQLVNNDAFPLFANLQLSYGNGILAIQGDIRQFYNKETPVVLAFEAIDNKKAFQYGVGRNKGYALTFKTAPDDNERMYLSGYEFKKVS